MSDDSFIREVNEDLRKEQAKALWDRYGPWAILVALIVVVGTAGWVAWDYWTETRANRSGDAFSQALQLANAGDREGALAALEALENDGFGAYPVLARLRAATLMAEGGDHQAAITAFDAVAGERAIPVAIRDMARLRAALLLVDHGSYSDVAARVEQLTTETNPLRHSAREALGLAAWNEGRMADAGALFDQILADETAPVNVRARAEIMSDLVRAAGSPD